MGLTVLEANNLVNGRIKYHLETLQDKYQKAERLTNSIAVDRFGIDRLWTSWGYQSNALALEKVKDDIGKLERANIGKGLRFKYVKKLIQENEITNIRDIDKLKFLTDSEKNELKLYFMQTNYPDVLKVTDADTDLHEQLKSGKLDKQAISELVKKDPSVLLKPDDNGNTPLHIAIIMGMDDPEIIGLLKGEGSSVLLKTNHFGNTPLHMAVRKEMEDPKIIKLLIDDKEKVLTKINKFGNTPLYMALVMEIKDIEIIKLLIDKKNEVLSMKDKNNKCTPLDVAIIRGFYAVQEYLVNRGAEVNKDFNSEFFLTKALGNVGGIDGEFKTSEGSIRLEGSYSHVHYFSLLREMLTSKSCPQSLKSSKDTLDAIDHFLDLKENQPKKILERIKSGKTTIIKLSTKEHAVYGVIRGDYFLIFNRGFERDFSGKSVYATKIDRSSITQEQIDFLLNPNNPLREKYTKIKGREDGFSSILMNSAEKQQQQHGNCAWVGPKHLVQTMSIWDKVSPSIKQCNDPYGRIEHTRVHDAFKEGYKKSPKATSLYFRREQLRRATEHQKENRTSDDFNALVDKYAKKLKEYEEKHPDAVRILEQEASAV